MEIYELRVTDAWIRLVHKSVSKHLDTWPGGDPAEQLALMEAKGHLDKLMLELLFSKALDG
jgi:hypothetical protein